MVQKTSKLVTDRDTFNARMLELLKEGNYTFMNTLINEIVYIRESFPDEGEVLVDHGVGHGKQYRLNIAFLDIYRPKERGVHQVFEDLLQGWVKPVVILLMLMLPILSNAQHFDFNREGVPNTLYIAYQPWDHGLGLRYDHHFSMIGLYTSASYGDWGLYRAAGYTNHVKLTAGILVPMAEYAGGFPDISVGLNYHYVEEFEVNDPRFAKTGLISYPWSFELGITMQLGRFAIGCRTDILRWEPCIDIGIPLDFKGKHSKHKVKMPKRQHTKFYF